jgi:16S rRNA (guanine1207-N2)-methyltransferase
MTLTTLTPRLIQLGAHRLTWYEQPTAPAWADLATPTTVLLDAIETPADHTWRDLRVLAVAAEPLALYAARCGAAVTAAPLWYPQARALHAAAQAGAQVSAYAITTTALQDLPADSYDLALMLAPKGLGAARLALQAVHHALKIGGVAWFVGGKDTGAKALESYAATLFGQGGAHSSKAHQRIGRARKQAAAPAFVLPFAQHTHGALTLHSVDGVFAHGRLDDGSAHLLRTVDAALCGGRRVLDVGCGAGVLGLTAATLGAASVQLIDAHPLAVLCAQHNIAANGLHHCRANASDLYSDVTDTFDLIVSNPPFHLGHAVDMAAATALIVGARQHLAAGGLLRIVCNAFLPYEPLLTQTFGAAQVVYSDERYKVLQARR